MKETSAAVRPVKIGIDARMFSDAFTGIGRYNFELTKRFFASHPEVEWVLFLNEPEFSKFNFPANVKKVRVDAAHYSLSEQSKFLRILNQEQCDLVHFTHFNVPLLYRGKFVVTIHDTTISFFPGKKMNSWIRRFGYQRVIRNAVERSAKIISVSENTKQDIVRLFHVNPSKITTVWNGISQDMGNISDAEKTAVKKEFKITDQFLFYTGVWREHKNLVGLLEAFAILRRDSRFQNLQLVLTGNPDPHYPEVMQTIQDLGLDSAVKRVGLVSFDVLRKLYAAASAYVFPSFYEGFGLPPLEAMQAGTPVVASHVSAIPEVCGDAAEYFDPRDPGDMADKISRVLTDLKRRDELVKKGYERVKLFSWDTCAGETFEIYDSVLKK